MNILITSAGRRVSLVRAFQKELKAYLPNAKVMTTDFSIETSPACQISDKALPLPLVTDKNYIAALIEVCIDNAVTLIIPTIDTELLLLSNHSKELIKNGIVPVISSVSLIEICRDKRKLHAFLDQKGIAVAKEYSKYNYKLPLFIKPHNGSRSLNTHLIKRHEDLTEDFFKDESLMFLQYLDHDVYDEYTCDLYYDKSHHLKCVVPRKRLETRDGEVSKGLTHKNTLVDYIKAHLGFLEGAVGCLTAQFFKHKEDKNIYCIEINARFGGGYPLSYLSGANFPKWLIQEYFLNETIDEFYDWEDNLLMLRYDEEILVHGYKN